MNYSFKKGLSKTLINSVIFLAPVVIAVLPETWQNMTLSGAIYMLVNFLKVTYSK
jgi:hypothetical protein